MQINLFGAQGKKDTKYKEFDPKSSSEKENCRDYPLVSVPPNRVKNINESKLALVWVIIFMTVSVLMSKIIFSWLLLIFLQIFTNMEHYTIHIAYKRQLNIFKITVVVLVTEYIK